VEWKLVKPWQDIAILGSENQVREFLALCAAAELISQVRREEAEATESL
jgi:hypothetical protein